jgi:hypothetical protein
MEYVRLCIISLFLSPSLSQLLRAAGFPFVAVLTTLDGRTTVCDAHEGMLMDYIIRIIDI